MAYALKYYSEFKNNVKDVYRVEIHEKDYTGNASEIVLTGDSFKLKYQSGDDSPIESIRASEAESSFYSEDNFSLLDFYSEDDEKYRVDFILVSIHSATGLYNFYSAIEDIVITGSSIYIDNQDSRHGIQPGMIIDILGTQYEIAGAFYFSSLQRIRLDVIGVPPAGTYPAEPFIILDYINTAVNLLKWRGFLVQDNCSQSFQDSPFPIRISATDNLGLLKDVSFDQAALGRYITVYRSNIIVVGTNAVINGIPFNPLSAGDIVVIDGENIEVTGTTYNPDTDVLNFGLATAPAGGDGTYTMVYKVYNQLVGKWRLIDYLRLAIQATGVVLPVRIFANIFEANHTEANTDELYSQTRFFSGKYLSEEGVWSNMYDIIQDILFRLNATIIQADGYWNIIRFQEYRAYGNNLPGVLFDENFENPSAITISPVFMIQHHTDIEFLNADAQDMIRRPYKFTREAFNYVQPKQLIPGIDLLNLGAFIGSETIEEGGVNFRLDKYQIPDFWSHEDSAPNAFEKDSSYIVVKTNTDENIEVERYIYQPHGNFSFKSLEFTPFPVDIGDIIGFSMSYKNVTNEGTDAARFRVRFLVVAPDGSSWNLRLFSPGGGALPYLNWANVTNNPVVTDGFWKTGLGVSQDAVQDSANYGFYDLETFTQDKTRPKIPAIPEAGMLRIGVQGFIDTNMSLPDPDGQFKDIRITVAYTNNGSVNAIGHTHKYEQPDNIKNVWDEDISIDDSPSSVTSGALFLDEFTGFLTGIGDVFFYKTTLWHRAGITEERKLGDIITAERKQISGIARTIVEGTVFGLRNGPELITPLSIAQIYTKPNLNFIFGVCEFDYYRDTFNASINELYKTGEVDVDADYEFKYLYETT